MERRLADRLGEVQERLAAACRRSGRGRDEVTLVAVTKTVSAAWAAKLPELGVYDLGESRPQELWRKAAAVPGSVRWHLVGHLQRNKVERTLPLVHLVHSVDSIRLLEALDAAAAKLHVPANALLEVNTSGERAKHGFALAEMPDLLPQLAPLNHARVLGLMTMAALSEEREDSRPAFATLRELRDRLRGAVPPPHDLRELSMGMSNDFETAVEEGATLVRIGTALFEGLPESAAP